MASIVTLTINPVIDKSCTVPALAPEKKLRCSEPVFQPGGGGINVARAISKLGGRALAIYPSGGHAGLFLNDLLEEEGVLIAPVPVSGTTRENFIVVDTATNNQYRFGMPGTPMPEADWQACLDAVNQQEDMRYLVVSGSLPPGLDPRLMAEFSRLAEQKGAKLVMDTSGEALRVAVQQGVYLLKPNLGELSALSGREELHPHEVPDAARALIRDGCCQLVVVSMGAAGALLVTKDEQLQAVAPPVKRRSTVGAGDSMVAGLVYRLNEGATAAEALRFGIACGTAATLNPGTELCRPEDVARLYEGVRVGKSEW